MTIQLQLPKDVEERLRADVNAGRYESIEAAILEKVSQSDDPELMSLTGMDAASTRSDLEDAWLDRSGSVDGEEFFASLAVRSASLKAQGK